MPTTQGKLINKEIGPNKVEHLLKCFIIVLTIQGWVLRIFYGFTWFFVNAYDFGWLFIFLRGFKFFFHCCAVFISFALIANDYIRVAEVGSISARAKQFSSSAYLLFSRRMGCFCS